MRIPYNLSKFAALLMLLFLISCETNTDTPNQVKQGVTGIVKSEATNTPIFAAKLYLENQANLGVITDSATSNTDGTFSVDVGEQGVYNVYCLKPGYAVKTVTAEVTKDKQTNVVILLSTQKVTAKIIGTVKDQNTSFPIKDVRVKLSGATIKETATDIYGKYSFDSLEVGIHTVTAEIDNYLIPDSESIFADTGTTQTVNFYLQPAATLRIHVRDFDTQEPIPNAKIHVGTDYDTITTDAFGNAVYLSPVVQKIVLDGFASNYTSVYDTAYMFQGTTTLDTLSLKRFDRYLVGSWKFSNNVLDATGKGHNGTKTGCTFIPDRFGNPSSAINFSASSDRVSVEDAPDLNFGKTTDFSICFWAKYTIPQPNYGIVVQKGKYNVNYWKEGYSVDFQGNGYQFQSKIASNIGMHYKDIEWKNDNDWHFYVVAISRQGRYTHYIDGKLSFSREFGVPELLGNVNTTAKLYFGGEGTVTRLFKGGLDDIKIYAVELNEDNARTLFQEK